MSRATAPYGSWQSPITSALLTSAGITFSELQFSNGRLYWLESRPDEAGRVVLVSDSADVTPKPFNVRTRVHEYGGGACFVHGDTVFFTNFTDQRLYRQDPGPRSTAHNAGASNCCEFPPCGRARDARRPDNRLRPRAPRTGPRSDQRNRCVAGGRIKRTEDHSLGLRLLFLSPA